MTRCICERFRIDADGHIRKMSFADKVEDLLYQVGSAFSVLGLVCMGYMVIL